MRIVWLGITVLACSLFVAGCNSNTPSTPNVVAETGDAKEAGEMLDVEWQWIQTVTPVEQIKATIPERYTLKLKPDGSAEMLFDCNRGGGSYEIDGNKLTFSPMMSTRMACADDTQDFVYMSFLQRVTSFFMRDEILYLELPMDSGTMHFRRADPEVVETQS